MSRVIITIDGPAGTGKSTVAHRLAERLGLEFLDTGAMYRAAALLALEQAIDPADGARLAEVVRTANMRFDWASDPPRLMLDARAPGPRLRDLDVAEIVSTVAAQPALRETLVARQRAIAEMHPRLVTEGRDQGSVVFPDAQVRFYLDAEVAVRAQRRMDQLTSAGQTVDEAKVVRGIVERDRIDSTRVDGPLVRPEGAVVVDTGTLSLEEVVDHLASITRERVRDAELGS